MDTATIFYDTTPETKTWEDAADDAVASVRSYMGTHAADWYLDAIDRYLEFPHGAPATIAALAMGGHIASGLGAVDTADLVDLLAGKQADYGHDNILRYGVEGIKVRISDKVCRLRNLLGNDLAATNESIKDSWLDIVGYAVIAIMLENGTFELPLAADAFPAFVESPDNYFYVTFTREQLERIFYLSWKGEGGTKMPQGRDFGAPRIWELVDDILPCKARTFELRERYQG